MRIAKKILGLILPDRLQLGETAINVDQLADILGEKTLTAIEATIRLHRGELIRILETM